MKIHLKKYGSTVMTVKDGDKTYLYSVEIIDDHGVKQIAVNTISFDEHDEVSDS